jgi:RimJ/RimL family protein N-acetyltransferase
MLQPKAGGLKEVLSMFLATLLTNRLEIRELKRSDLEACEQLNRELSGGDAEKSIEQTREWLEWTILSYRQLAELCQPPYGERAVVLRQSGEVIGRVGLVPLLEPFEQLPSLGASRVARYSTEIGLYWAIRPSFRRSGYATEAARALVQYAFESLQVRRLIAGTEYSNESSIAVMKKLGMRIERNPFGQPEWFQVRGTLEPK